MIFDSSEVRNSAEEICHIGQRIWQRGLVASNDGNISVRTGPSTILCTPSQVSKGFMRPDEMAVCNMDAQLISGVRPATSEIRMHIAAYDTRPDIKAVVHTHAPHAIAASLFYDQLPSGLIAEVELALGIIPIAEYLLPGTWDFANSLRDYFKDYNAVILRHHGVVTIGENLEEAYFRTESVEHYCKILCLSPALGARKHLSGTQMQELANVRTQVQSQVQVHLVDEVIKRVRDRLGKP